MSQLNAYSKRRTIKVTERRINMKSYTDLEQSKKLAEILPLESADNVIVTFGNREGTKTLVMPKETFDVLRTPFSDIRNVIPCWSLAALLDILQYPTLFQHANQKWGCTVWIDTVKPYSISDKDEKDEPVDACVAMIEKLHEEKLL